LNLNFVVKGENYCDEFFVLPQRIDELVILVKNWLRETKKIADEIDDINHLLDLLCRKGKRSVKYYECRIDTAPGALVVTKPTKIPQAIENLFMKSSKDYSDVYSSIKIDLA
jgi:hypothetical protein